MSAQPEQPDGTPGNRNISARDETEAEEEQQQDVWVELFSLVHGVGDTVGLALQAFTPTDDKAVSAITKKRLALRSIHGLKQSQTSIETLLEHLKALQAASQTWQRSMMYASKSHQELMEQVETTTEELHKTNERLRAVEAQRLAAVREAELLKARVEQQETGLREARRSMKQREEELENLQFSVHELQSTNALVQQNLEDLRQAAAEADDRAHAATTALDGAKAEATKAQASAERHQQVVAKLTADNLVFLMQLKKVEADLAAANQERAQLRLAAEQQRGPWFDQVRAGVEERVRQAFQRSQELELRIERREAEHAAQIEAMQTEQGRLEELLSTARQDAHDLQERLGAATEAKERAEALSAAAEVAVREARKELENLAAENRVLQESIRSMRQECTERWVNEQAAVGRVDGLEQRIAELQQRLSQQEAQLAALQQQLDTQTGINRQLMARKEEIEWQLMAAMAKIDGGGPGDHPVPLNLRVSGLLQVGGGSNSNDPRPHSSTPDLPAGGRDGYAGNIRPAAIAAASTSESSADGGAGGRSATRVASGPGNIDPVRQVIPTTGTMLPLHPQPAPQTRGPPAHAALPAPVQHASGSSEHPPSPTHSRLPDTSLNGLVQGASGTVVQTLMTRSSGGGGSGGGGAGESPSRSRPWRDASGSLGLTGTALMPEPTLLFAHEDLATITHAGPRGSAPAGTMGRASSLEPTRLLLRQQQQGGMRGEVGPGAGFGAGGVGPEVHTRWTSLEGASTVVSSPPSSVALSTEPGSPGEAPFSLPSEISSREPRAASVTIRTALTGQRRPGSGAAPGASPFVLGRDRAQASGGGAHTAAAGDRAAAQPHVVQGAVGAVVERRGSLHDGSDIWLPDVPSSSSSDGSDFFFSTGVVVQREAHMGPEPRNVHTTAQQAQLYQLQQRLQLVLQVPPAAAAPAAAAVRESAAAEQRQAGTDSVTYAGRQPQGTASNAQGAHGRLPGCEDDDVIHTRAPLQRSGDTSGVTIRTAIPMRTGPAGPRSNVAKLVTAAGQTSEDANDQGVGVFSITKGSAQAAAVLPGASSGGSPMHPAFSARQGPTTPQGAGPSSPQQQQPASLSTSAVGAASANDRSEQAPPPEAAFPPAAAPTVTLVADAALRESAGGAPSDADPVPSRVQAGPPFYATGLPLDGSAALALERWALSAVGHPPRDGQNEGSVPPSPARSTTSLRSPRSPPHPAIVLVRDREATAPAGAAAMSGAPTRSLREPPVVTTEAPAPRPQGAAAAATSTAPWAGSAVNHPTRTADGKESSGLSRVQIDLAASPVQRGASGAAAEVTAGPPAKPRVSFHGLTLDSQPLVATPGDASVAAGVGHAPAASSMSSSTGSLIQGIGAAGGPHRPSSVKSVRFSDHEPEDDVAQALLRSRRESQEQQGLGAALRASLRTPASQAVSAAADRTGQPQRSPSSHEAEGMAVAGLYRSRGPVPHPAMVGVSTEVSAAAGGMADTTLPKRYSAAGVVTTSVPRAATNSGQ